MSSIVLSHLSCSTPQGQPLFIDLNLTFNREKTGLVGRNGIGKSTLLKIIAGQYQVQSGTVSVSGTIGVLRQSVQIESKDTIADLFGVGEALAVLNRALSGEGSLEDLSEADWTLEERVAEALGRVGLDAAPDTLLVKLSGGQRTRASLASAIFAEPDFMLLDEPTNNLDRAGRDAVLDLLSNWKAGAVVVSHDRELLEHMESIVELTSLGANRYGGNWSRYRERKAIELEAAEKDVVSAEKRLSEVTRKAQMAVERRDRRDAAGASRSAKGDLPRILLGARKNGAEASRSDGARLAERQKAQALEDAALARSRVEVLQELSIVLPSTGLSSGRTVLTLDDVSAGYNPDKPVLRNFTLSITGPERVAITGPNGTGKTTLLNVIAGDLSPSSGQISMTVDFARLDQRVRVLDPKASIIENFKRLNPGASETACRAILAGFLFRADAAQQIVDTLSGGQMLRAALACVLGETPPPLLILDEPTNHLDIESIRAIESALSAYDGALLIVSHDNTFLANIGVNRAVSLDRPSARL